MKKFVLLTTSVMLFILGGCSVNKERNVKDDGSKLTEEEVKQEILDYLENKYGEEFECFGIEYAWWGQPGQESMDAYPKGGNKYNTFPVYRYYNDSNNTIRYEDGYIGYIMEPQYLEKVKSMVNTYVTDCVVRSGYNREVYPNNMKKDISYEAFKVYSDKRLNITTGIFTSLSQEEAEKVIDVIALELQNEFMIGTISITGYTVEGYQKYVVEDCYDAIKMEEAFTTKDKTYYIERKWGSIDKEYKYEGENN